MLSGQDKVWIHYRNDIIASDVTSAIFLSAMLRHNALHRSYVHHLEIIDLQKYKVLKDPVKVRIALRERMHVPFVFVTGKN